MHADFPLNFRWMLHDPEKIHSLIILRTFLAVECMPSWSLHVCSSVTWFIHSFGLTFECPLCARHCSSHWRLVSVQNRKKRPCLMEFLFRGEMGVKPNEWANSVVEGEMYCGGKKWKQGEASDCNFFDKVKQEYDWKGVSLTTVFQSGILQLCIFTLDLSLLPGAAVTPWDYNAPRGDNLLHSMESGFVVSFSYVHTQPLGPT